LKNNSYKWQHLPCAHVGEADVTGWTSEEALVKYSFGRDIAFSYVFIHEFSPISGISEVQRGILESITVAVLESGDPAISKIKSVTDYVARVGEWIKDRKYGKSTKSEGVRTGGFAYMRQDSSQFQVRTLECG
jgi:hypothetical protein